MKHYTDSLYKCKHFSIEELVPKPLFDTLHEDVLWGMFDPELLKAADWLRERYGQATINNWKWGGVFSQSGIRTKDSSFYSEGSMHSVGKALDIKFKNISAEAIRADLKAMNERGEMIPYIRRIEDSVSWLHADVKPQRGVMKGYVYFFKP